VRLTDLDGERLLVHSPPGTPFTDLQLTAVAAAGARVRPVESRVTGAPTMSELRSENAIALHPAGWPAAPGIVELALEDPLTLPLIVLWAASTVPPAVCRLRRALSSSA
jgi:hypothetical protein